MYNITLIEYGQWFTINNIHLKHQYGKREHLFSLLI